MPCLRPLSSASGSWASWPSPITRVTGAVASSTSRAATRPPPAFFNSTCATAPRNDSAIEFCTALRISGGASSTKRWIASAVDGAVIETNTSRPSDAAVSNSGTMCGETRSSTTSTSGFSRNAARAAATESSAPPRISRWLTSADLLSCTSRIWRSSVMTNSARCRFTRSTSAEINVDLPPARGPAISTRPCDSVARACTSRASPSCSAVAARVAIMRNNTPGPRWSAKVVQRIRPTSANSAIHSVGSPLPIDSWPLSGAISRIAPSTSARESDASASR